MREMLTVGIVDDEDKQRAELVNCFRQYERENPVDFTIREYASGEELMAKYSSDFDIITMDVMMNGDDGFSVARAVRNCDFDVPILFVTTAAQLAIRGYEVSAMNYMLKPVSYFAFKRDVDRCVTMHRQRHAVQMLTLPIPGSVARVPLDDVTYIESCKGHRIAVHTFGQTYGFIGTLKAFREKLEPDCGFISCNSCYLVNLRHVTGLCDNDCELRDGTMLAVSRRCRRPLLQALAATVV